MTLQYGTTLRNNKVSQIQTTVGSSGVLKVFSGAEPANPAAADPSGLLATITLPSTFLTSSGGVTTIAGTWSVAASGSGTASSWRIYDGSAVCHVQGSTADMTFDNTSISSGQTITVTAFSITASNA
jgi:hypothetical protein